MATNLESQMQNYNNKNLDDNSKVYDTKDLLNQLINLVPNLYKGTLTVSSQRVSLNTDWETLKVNQIYRVEDISGVNSPDKNKLDGNTAGTLFVYGDEALGTNFKVFVSGSMIVYKQQSDSQYYYLGKDYATNTDLDTAIKTLQDKLTQLLSTKVTDNHDGTEQLNGVQVQPFNKLSDTIGGRNLLTGTSGTLQTVTNASWYNSNLPVITPVVTTVNSDTTYTARAWLAPASHDMQVQVVWTDSSGTTYYGGGNTISAGTSGYSTWTGTFTAGTNIQRVTIIFTVSQSTNSTVSYKEMKLEKGSIATDWTPAPEDIIASNKTIELANGVDIDTVVKSGIYGYTSNNPSGAKHGPDGHDSWFLLEVNDLMGDSVNGVQKYYDTNDGTGFVRMWNQNNSTRAFTPWAPSAEVGVEADGADLNNSLQVGTFFSATKVTNGPGFYNQGYGDAMITWRVIRVLKGGTSVYTQTAYNQRGNMAVRNFVSGAGWGAWTIVDGGNALNANDDLFNLPDGTYSVVGSAPKNWPSNQLYGRVTLHSWKSSNGRDVNVVDSAGNVFNSIYSGNPASWSTWSEGGTNVASAADLKSVADKAWYQLDNKYVTVDPAYSVNTSQTIVLYKIDTTNKRVYLQGTIFLNNPVSTTITISLSSIIKNITSPANTIQYYGGSSSTTYYAIFPGNSSIRVSATTSGMSSIIQSGPQTISSATAAYVTYDELV